MPSDLELRHIRCRCIRRSCAMRPSSGLINQALTPTLAPRDDWETRCLHLGAARNNQETRRHSFRNVVPPNWPKPPRPNPIEACDERSESSPAQLS